MKVLVVDGLIRVNRQRVNNQHFLQGDTHPFGEGHAVDPVGHLPEFFAPQDLGHQLLPGDLGRLNGADT